MTDERNQRLFSYGTLQLAEVQMAQFKRLLDGEDDAMPGFAQAMVEITDPEVLRKSGRRFHPLSAKPATPPTVLPARSLPLLRTNLRPPMPTRWPTTSGYR